MSTTPNMNADKIFRTDRDVPHRRLNAIKYFGQTDIVPFFEFLKTSVLWWRLVGLWGFVGIPDGRRLVGDASWWVAAVWV